MRAMRMRTRTALQCTALALLGGLALWPASVAAYVTMKYGSVELRWTSLPMKFSIHTAYPSGVGAAATQAAIRAAYQTWSNVSCSSFRSQDMGLVNLPWGDKDDHINTHSFTSSWPSNYDANALGITWTQYDPSSGKIIDADTHYNPNDSWAANGAAFATDIQSVATHEIGHELGLDHTPVQQATMFYATGAGDTSQRSLDSDDIAGLCHLYPSGQPLPPECSLPEHCAPNETCVNGKCVSSTKKGYGSPCSSPKECDSGICLESSTASFCSQSCDYKACPNGDQCLTVSGGGDIAKACLYGSGTWGTKKLGDPCKVGSDCTTKLCGSVPGKGYLCLQKCDRFKQDCPKSFTCSPAADGAGYCVPANVTPPPPPPNTKKKLGATCAAPAECESNLCAQSGTAKVCLQSCTPGAAAGCPDGYHCEPLESAQGGCFKDGASPITDAEIGETCEQDSNCKSSLCFDDGQGQLYCSSPCDPLQGCQGGFDCVDQGDGSICVLKAEGSDNPSKGCTLSPITSRSGFGGGLLLLLGLALAALLSHASYRRLAKRSR